MEPAKLEKLTLPAAPTLATTRLGLVSPAGTLRFEALGSGSPVRRTRRYWSYLSEPHPRAELRCHENLVHALVLSVESPSSLAPVDHRHWTCWTGATADAP